MHAGCSRGWLLGRDFLNKFNVHDDGKTAYERIARRRCNHKVVDSGDSGSARWQMAPDKTARDKLHGDFRDGIFLGHLEDHEVLDRNGRRWF